MTTDDQCLLAPRRALAVKAGLVSRAGRRTTSRRLSAARLVLLPFPLTALGFSGMPPAAATAATAGAATAGTTHLVSRTAPTANSQKRRPRLATFSRSGRPPGHGLVSWLAAADGRSFLEVALGRAARISVARTAAIWSRTQILAAPGAVGSFGDAPRPCSARYSAANIVSIDFSPNGRGYWAVSNNGSVFTCGNAHFWGSIGTIHRATSVQAIAALPNGLGYWLAAKNGGVYAFGRAKFYGRPAPSQLDGPVVGLAATPSGRGYWLATAAGGVFSFGDARFYGSAEASRLPAPVVSFAASPRGGGYWLATADGHVYPFGAARGYGSLAGDHHVTAIAADQNGRGYWLLSPDGSVHAFGSARSFGHALTGPSTSASTLSPTPDGNGYAIATRRPAAQLISSSPQTGSFLGTFTVTCYDLAGVTASGSMAGPGGVAVDPRVIPLGTRIYIQGVGERTADDTGGAIIGSRLDIWEPTWSQCANWGVEQRAVYSVAP